jgi:hypothetical protein
MGRLSFLVCHQVCSAGHVRLPPFRILFLVCVDWLMGWIYIFVVAVPEMLLTLGMHVTFWKALPLTNRTS